MLKNLGILFLNPSTSTVVHLTETNEVELYSVYKWATFCSALFRSQNNTANLLEKTPSWADTTEPELPHSTHYFWALW